MATWRESNLFQKRSSIDPHIKLTVMILIRDLLQVCCLVNSKQVSQSFRDGRREMREGSWSGDTSVTGQESLMRINLPVLIQIIQFLSVIASARKSYGDSLSQTDSSLLGNLKFSKLKFDVVVRHFS